MRTKGHCHHFLEDPNDVGRPSQELGNPSALRQNMATVAAGSEENKSTSYVFSGDTQF